MVTSDWSFWRRMVGAWSVLTGRCVATVVSQPRNEDDARFRKILIRDVPGLVSATFWENYGMYRLYIELSHGSIVYVTLDDRKKPQVGIKNQLELSDMPDYDVICARAELRRQWLDPRDTH